jgi:nickel/cobalt transporter (NicO) family protein
MTSESGILMLTAASVGMFHTLLGPDHYIPFIVLSKARGWTTKKTALITLLCGLGHVGSSVILGFSGIALGTAISRLTGIESTRGTIAAWMMISFGFLYMVWGIRDSIQKKEHSHIHFHADGTSDEHTHSHNSGHTHLHQKMDYKELTPWLLFMIFVLGPCEPFIPVLLFPAAQHHFADMIRVTAVFTLTTTGTMLLMVLISLSGLRYLPIVNIRRYLHPIAGGTIFLCGMGIKLLGL